MTPLALVLLACGGGVPTADTAPVGAITFPHAEGYDAGGSHGPEALQHGELCGSCHRDGSDAPTCASCHDTWPHPVGWLAGARHGEGLTGDQGAAAREPCLACHGVAGLTAAACADCHASWPHPEGWKDAGEHGAWARARGSATAACGNCHGAALEGTPTAPSCVECHPVYPHPPGFGAPQVHGADPDVSVCADCHGALGEGGPSGVACSRCHATFPHPPDQAVAHVAQAARVGERVCLECHAPGEAGFPVPAACGAICHGVAP